ncbi:F-box protein At4g22280-like isoform X1 [Bidens hawaiensis]|uniref:F-box protein At4g22280-like isoform X1 n=2 Tax=Bidens hawaiensis TaxID=980011 RepID=UPI00404A419A
MFRNSKEAKTMSENIHHNQHEVEHADGMIDGISSLPDGVLHHMLSLLPTKDVVRTSAVSKRWKNLWASVPNLDFDDTLLYASEVDHIHSPESTSFMNFVERILRFRDTSKIEKFRLSCRVCFNSSRISSWISSAIMYNVRELDLCIFADDSSVIPQSLFDCKSLVILKIEMDCVLVFPPRVSFPCLKTLHLSLVTFADDDSIGKFFASCLVLEDLVLLDCDCINLKNLTISSWTLKRLTIDDIPVYEPNGCKIKIDAKNLKYLKYTGYLPNEISLSNAPSLVEASIHIPILNGRQKEVACRAVDLLKGLQNVVFLRVSNCTMECLIFAGSMLARFPVFPKLTHLVLTMEIGDYTFGAFMDLFNFCPTLQSINLSEGFDQCIELGENDSVWSPVPICISRHLKTLTFKNFHANDSEICFLKCILKYALVLEKMDIWWCTARPRDKKERDVMKELEMIKRCSTACVITFP